MDFLQKVVFLSIGLFVVATIIDEFIDWKNGGDDK